MPFAWNLLLAFVWAMATGEFSLNNLIAGFALAYGILLFTQPFIGSKGYSAKTWKAIRFVGFFLKELVKANLRVAYDVMTPSFYMHPGVVAVPLEAKTDGEITLLANLISLTPGTLSLDVSDDRSVLYVHSMFVDDVHEFRREIKEGFERRVLELLR
jgi:multicomponent Na+:H+ antiporter subunit E